MHVRLMPLSAQLSITVCPKPSRLAVDSTRMVQGWGVDEDEITRAFEDAFDQALVFHGFADYMRDYDVYVYATADPRTGISPEHLRYRFTHCVRATVTSAVAPDVWARSLDDRFTDYQTWVSSGEAEGSVWGVKWQGLYPGMQLLPQTAETQEWSARLGLLFHEALIETNGHNISLVFSGLTVTTVAPGHAPFVVPSGPDSKFPLE
jgi:hypothetical protein